MTLRGAKQKCSKPGVMSAQPVRMHGAIDRADTSRASQARAHFPCHAAAAWRECRAETQPVSHGDTGSGTRSCRSARYLSKLVVEPCARSRPGCKRRLPRVVRRMPRGSAKQSCGSGSGLRRAPLLWSAVQRLALCCAPAAGTGVECHTIASGRRACWAGRERWRTSGPRMSCGRRACARRAGKCAVCTGDSDRGRLPRGLASGAAASARVPACATARACGRA